MLSVHCWKRNFCNQTRATLNKRAYYYTSVVHCEREIANQSNMPASTNLLRRKKMSPDENKAIIRRYIELWNNKDTNTLQELQAPTYVEHGPGGEEGDQVLQQFLDDYSEYHFTITKMV